MVFPLLAEYSQSRIVNIQRWYLIFLFDMNDFLALDDKFYHLPKKTPRPIKIQKLSSAITAFSKLNINLIFVNWISLAALPSL